MIPQDIEKQKQLANHIQQLAIYEQAKKGFIENSKDIKFEIKEIAGKDFDITSAVNAVVDKMALKSKADEAVAKAEEGIANAEILEKHFSKNIYDEADKYLG